ncbi:hypothetical protein ABZ901_02240 [Actinacidiphila alni]|uniref:hypothetical protein n=1 Tax=Actinacidiphila alni TaxID=380248 RepID=UPI0033E29C3A
MATVSGPSGPVIRDPGQWATLSDCKKVLVVVHTLVYGQRLEDVFELLRSDLRIHVMFTMAPHAFNPRVHRYLEALDGQVLPWSKAVTTEFDLILAAGSQGLEQLHGPVLRVPHGAGHTKLSRPGDAPRRTVGGLGRNYLMWGDRVVPAAYALAHDDDLAQLSRTCPEAVPIAEVVGDASYDRIVRSLPLREDYRRAVGLRDGEKLVLVSSTWGTGSSFNRMESLLPRLLTELDPVAGYRTALLLHPNVWSGHGGWQIRAWLRENGQGAVPLVTPEADWRPLLVAADFVLGDHGSVTLYASMCDVPIVMTRFPGQGVNPRSPATALASLAPALSPTHPLPRQLAYARDRYESRAYHGIADRISSEPGRFNRNMRKLLYRLLRIGEPAHEPSTRPLPLPEPLPTALVSGGDV